MKAIVFRGVRDLEYAEVPEPAILDPRDVVVRVQKAAICGSDLHPYRGGEVGLDVGTIFGHEFLGVVTEVGDDVAKLRAGDRVLAPFSTSCGACFYCERGLTARCDHGQLFGWVEEGRGLHGAQAELVRVPLADTTLLQIPAGAEDEEVLLAGDVLSTGSFVSELGGVGPDTAVAVLGAGPVGLMACFAAIRSGSRRVYSLDMVPERLALAERFGAIPLDLRDEASVKRVSGENGGRGVDCVLECVGSPQATRLAIDIVRPGGTIAAAGVHTEATFAFSPVEAYDKNLTYRAGRCPARHMMERTLPMVAEEKLGLGAIFSHRLPLEAGPDAYRIFDERLDNCTKILLTP